MHSLLLHCDVPQWRPTAPDAVARVLADAGLIGAAQGSDVLLYGAGEQFLSLVTFLGCSPRISLTEADAADGQPLCRIRLHDFDDVTLLESQPPPALRCAGCRAAQPRPVSLHYDWRQPCAKCGVSLPLHRCDWRRGAAFGRFFVEIENVFPHEAVPADLLMSRLESLSDSRWDYFYLSRDAVGPTPPSGLDSA